MTTEVVRGNRAMPGQTENRAKCAYQGDAGPCEAWAQQDNDYCYFHDPAKADTRALASAKGGRNSHRKLAGLPDAQAPQTSQNIAETMGQVIAGVLRGDLDPRIGNSVAYCCATLIKAIEVSELERRLAALEKARKPRNHAVGKRKISIMVTIEGKQFVLFWDIDRAQLRQLSFKGRVQWLRERMNEVFLKANRGA
jgi:hypothetical protein